MACPSCGEKFYSDFKIRGENSKPPRSMNGNVNVHSKGLLRWLYEKYFCFWFKS